jgi:hypothetical protein
VPDDLLIALNPEEDSSLPYLIRIPLGAAGIVLKTKDTWPRTSSCTATGPQAGQRNQRSLINSRCGAARVEVPLSI